MHNLNPQNDQVTLVDEHDVQIGVMDKVAAHRLPIQRHRAISVWLKNAKNEVLFQKRSAKKIVGAGQWGNTACGNVWPGESYETCARRRLKVELGIENVELQPLYTFEYRLFINEEFGEHEIDHVFVGEYGGEVRPNPYEVSEFCWIPVGEIQEVLQQNAHVQNILTAPESLTLLDAQLKEKSAQLHVVFPATSQYSELFFTSWTSLMFFDKRVGAFLHA